MPPIGEFVTGALVDVKVRVASDNTSILKYIPAIEWNAIAAGTTTYDASSAIQTAANDTTVGAIFFPPGVYRLGSPITLSVSSGKQLIFDSKAIIRRVFNGAAMFLVSGNGYEFIGGEFDGNKASFAHAANAGIFITGSRNKVYDVYMHDCKSHGLSIDGDAGEGFQNRIINNRVWLVDEVGISQFKAKQSFIAYNDISSAGAEGITVDINTVGTVVHGNKVRNCARIGAVGGIGVDLSNYNTISDNYIVGTLNGLPGITLECQAGNTFHNTISGNNIVSNTGYGIWLRRRSIIFPTPTGGFGQSDWNTIVGNTFQSNTLAPVRIDELCIGNVLSGNSYDGLLPDIDAAAVSTRVDNGLVAFHAKNSVTRVDVTGDGTLYTIPFNVETLDRGPGFDPSTGIFTAPVTGIYVLSASARLEGGALHDWMVIYIVAGSNTFANGVEAIDQAVQMCTVSASAYLQKGQTALVRIAVGGSTKVVAVASDPNHTWFTGTLLA